VSDKFEQWWQDNSHPTIAESSKDWASLGYHGGYQDALASQAKEIEEVRELLRSGTEDFNKAAAALTTLDALIHKLMLEIHEWGATTTGLENRIEGLQEVLAAKDAALANLQAMFDHGVDEELPLLRTEIAHLHRVVNGLKRLGRISPSDIEDALAAAQLEG
jgi:chromosome segregation ATPase